MKNVSSFQFFCAALTLQCLTLIHAFAPSSTIGRNLQQTLSRKFIHLQASKEEEIQALEEKLRLLKQEAAETTTPLDEAGEPPATTSKEEEEEEEELTWKVPESKRPQDSTIAVRKVPIASMDDPFDEMLSEQWKVKNNAVNGSSSSGGIMNIVGVVAILLGIVAFSQVPIGQEDLDKYSTAKPSTSIDLG